MRRRTARVAALLVVVGVSAALVCGCGVGVAEIYGPFEGITETNVVGDVVAVDPEDWCAARTLITDALYVAPDTLAFRFAEPGVGTADVRVLNYSTEPVTIVSTSAAWPVEVDTYSALLSSGESIVVGVTFTQAGLEDYEGEIVIETSPDQGTIAVPVTGGIDASPEPEYAFSFGPAYPNPCTTQVTFPYEVPEISMPVLSIFDESGVVVSFSYAQAVDPGVHEIVWDLTDLSGARVPPGVYGAVLVTADYECWGDVEVRE